MDALILFVTAMVLAYWRMPAKICTTIFAVELVLFSFLTEISFFQVSFFWSVFLLAAVFANSKALRCRFFTAPLMDLLKKQLPPISETEREAILAGHVWFEKELFCGRPSWKTLLAIPQPTLSNEEQAFLDGEVETLCEMLDDWKIVNEQHDLSPEVWHYLKEQRFLGMVIPKEYGGRGFSALAHSTVVMKIASRSVSAAVNMMVPNSLGPGELILHYGTTEQKNYYLPRLARGEEIPCFGLTSAFAGSDASGMIDYGVVCQGDYQGKTIVGVRLTWDKRYITLAPIATVIGIAFKLYDPDHLLGQGQERGITLCLVPSNHPGVESGHRHLPMNFAFMNGPVRGRDVFIPLDWIIGGVDGIGRGWKMLMECLSIGRAISLPALSAAAAAVASRRVSAYASVRRQFNTTLVHFEGIEEALSQIMGMAYQIDAVRTFTVGAVDLKLKPSTASAIAKYHLTEMSRKVVMHAMDIMGGHAIQLGPRNRMAASYFAIPISITVEGANILTRCLIIFGQGAIRCHPYVYEEIEWLSQPKTAQSIAGLDSLLIGHIGYLLSNIVRSVWFGLSGGLLQSAPVRGASARYYRQLTRMSSALALLSDVTMMLLGGDLKRKERTSARLGDILSQLYLASAVLKQYEDRGQLKAEQNCMAWCVESNLHAIQLAIDDLLANYQPAWLGKVLHWLIFPWRRRYQKPTDRLLKKVVSAMVTPSEVRKRLLQYCYLSKRSDDSDQQLEALWATMDQVEPLLKKMRRVQQEKKWTVMLSMEDQFMRAQQAGILSREEAQALMDFEKEYRAVIAVDEFSFNFDSIIRSTE